MKYSYFIRKVFLTKGWIFSECWMLNCKWYCTPPPSPLPPSSILTSPPRYLPHPKSPIIPPPPMSINPQNTKYSTDGRNEKQKIEITKINIFIFFLLFFVSSFLMFLSFFLSFYIFFFFFLFSFFLCFFRWFFVTFFCLFLSWEKKLKHLKNVATIFFIIPKICFCKIHKQHK